VVSKATLDLFLEPEDYPLFHGVHGTPDDFSCAQHLSDWVRLILLEKYGGVWLDASAICTNTVYVESWVSPDPSQISTMFPMHANSTVHGNWAMAVSTRGHQPLIRAWRKELAAVCNRTLPGKVPVESIDRAFDNHPSLVELRINAPIPQPVPYLWTYLELQVVLQKQPTLIHLLPGIDDPMHHRYRCNIEVGSALEALSRIQPYGVDLLRSLVLASNARFRAVAGSLYDEVDERSRRRSIVARSA
jgi:hypothetical protein